MAAQALFSHRQLEGKNTGELQEMMWREHHINWNDFSTSQKRGTCVIKEKYEKEGVQRSRWVTDEDIPIFTQDRDYINKFVFVE